MALLPWEFEKRANISAAEKFGNDGTPDARADQLNDQITPLVLTEEEMSRAEPPEDDMDARDAAAHRKKTAVWSLKQRKARASSHESSPAHDQQFDRRAPFDPVEQERRMLRDQEAPGVVWTMGEDSLGQSGHAAARPDQAPYPALIEPRRLKGGVRSIHAGPVCTISVGVRARSAPRGRLTLAACYDPNPNPNPNPNPIPGPNQVCTIVLNEVGEALGFGSGALGLGLGFGL